MSTRAWYAVAPATTHLRTASAPLFMSPTTDMPPTPTCPQCMDTLTGPPILPSPANTRWDGVLCCPSCGLCTLWPPPADEELSAIYARSGNWEIRSREQTDRQCARRAALVEKHVSVGRLYEVGASRGEFMAYMRARGWFVEGLEPGLDDVADARDRYGLEIEHAFFDGSRTGGASYDAIVAWDVLEHCKEPAEVLRAMKTFVRPGGIIVIAVPNIEGWGVKLFKEKWRYRMSPIHVHFFTDTWWTQQCERLGLERVDTAGYAKVQAWLQGALPARAKSFIIDQMKSGADEIVADGNTGPDPSAARGATGPRWLMEARTLARKAVFELNQRPAPLPLADLVEVVLRVR